MIRKHFLRNEAISDDSISSPRPLVSTRISKFDSFIYIAYDSSNPDTIIDLKSRSPLLLRARRLRGSFSIILHKVSRLFPFFESLSKFLKKLLFVEYLIFGDEGIQTILLRGYGFSVWLTYCFGCFYLGNVVNSYNHRFASFSIQVPRNRGKTIV